MKRTFLAIALSASLGLSSNAVFAAAISGQVQFFGQAAAVDNTATPATLDSATGIQFFNPVAVTTASGDFNTLTPFVSTAQFTDFSFNPLNPSPVNPLWIAGGFSFVMTTIEIVTQNSSELTLKGSGYVTGAGFDNTLGFWNFSGFSGGIGTSRVGQTFSFEATSIASAVPDEGSTITLLGLVVAIGLGVLAMKQSRLSVATVRR